MLVKGFARGLQRIVSPSIRSLAIHESDQLCLAFAIQTVPFETFAREATDESHLQTLLDKWLLDANYRAATDGERFGNLPIGVTRPTLAVV